MFSPDWIIFKCITGSHLYGTATLESDVDIRGVCIPPKSIQDDPFSNFEQAEIPGEDTVYYGLKKFIQLASDCNPNIIELMFVDSPHISIETPYWTQLMRKRNYFLSKKCKFTFTGYAMSQLKRIKLHREWLLNPPHKIPEREDYGLPDTPIWGLEKIINLINSPKECIKEEYRDLALREQSYRSAKEYWDNYVTWLKTRNIVRAALEAKSGYDTKHGMHLYRLLGEGLELLETAFITFPRPDKDLLLAIRNGEFTYDQLMGMVGDFQTKMDNAITFLPEHPNYKQLSELYQELTS